MTNDCFNIEIECRFMDTLYRLGLSHIAGTFSTEHAEDSLKYISYPGKPYVI